MLQPQLFHSIGHAPRLEHIQRIRPPCGDIAKRAAPRADLAHDHHSGVALLPALADIRAARLGAHCGKVVIFQYLTGITVALRRGRLHPYPAWLAQNRRIGLMRLFRVALGFIRKITAHGKLLKMYGTAIGIKHAFVHHFA